MDELGAEFDKLGAEEVEEVAEVEVAEGEEPEGEEVELVEELEPLDPPQMWGKEYRELFNEWGQLEGGRKYQEAMRELYGQIQGYTTQKEQEAAQYRRSVEEWNGTFQQHQDWLAQNGLSPHDAARKGVGVLMQIAQDPKKFATQILDRIGYDYSSHGADQPYVPPEVQSLQQQVQQLSGALQQQQQQAYQHQVQQVQQRIESFATAADASGNPAHPYFEYVHGTMAGLINAGQARDLDDAYAKALKLHDDIVQQDSGAREAQEAARKAAAAKKAKTAAKRPAGKHSGTDTTARSVKDDLYAAWDAHASA